MSVLIENMEMPKDCAHCRFNSASGQITALCDLVGWIKIKENRRADDCPLAETQPERLSDDDFETIRIHSSAIKERLGNQHRWKEAEDYQRLIDRFMSFAERPEIMADGTLHITVNADVANIDRILLSQAGTHSGDLYYKDNEKPEIIRCKDCKYNVSRNHKCLQPDSFFLVTEDDFYCGYAERRYNEQPN